MWVSGFAGLCIVGCIGGDGASWGALALMAPRVGYGDTGYLELILVFVWNSAQWEKSNFCFLRVAC